MAFDLIFISDFLPTFPNLPSSVFCTDTPVKYLSLKVFVLNCKIYLSQIIKYICLKMQNIFVSPQYILSTSPRLTQTIQLLDYARNPSSDAVCHGNFEVLYFREILVSDFLRKNCISGDILYLWGKWCNFVLLV